MVALEVPSLVDAVYEALRSQILDGAIEPGKPLTEAVVATEFSVARVTAKAAVERLVHDGLLRRTANKSARVPVLEAADVRDVYFSRQIFESAVVDQVAALGSVPQAARTALTAFDQAVADNDLVRVVETDVGFHTALVESLGSARLTRTFRSFTGEMQLCMAQVQYLKLLDPRTIAAEHASIVEAIEVRSSTLAVERLRSHLENAGHRIVGVLESRAREDQS